MPLLRRRPGPAIVTAYEVQVALTRAIDLHSHRIDHVAYLGPSVAAGLGTLLGLADPEVTYQAINQALHVTTATRQSRKDHLQLEGLRPAHAGKLGVEAVDRAMRGQTAPAPIWEGEDAVVAWLLDGPGACYRVPPTPGEPRRAILDTFTKAPLGRIPGPGLHRPGLPAAEGVGDTGRVERVVLRTSDHTHNVIGTGLATPRSSTRRPPARPWTTRSCTSSPSPSRTPAPPGQLHPERAARPDTVRLWHRVETVEDPAWTARYHDGPGLARLRRPGRGPPGRRRGGRRRAGRGRRPPQRAAPFARPDYRRKLATLADGRLAELDRFAGLVERLGQLALDELAGLTVTADHLAGGRRRPGIL